MSGYDFVQVRTDDDRTSRMLSVINEDLRKCLVIKVDHASDLAMSRMCRRIWLCLLIENLGAVEGTA